MTDIQSILKRYWGFDSFRPQQEEIISSVLHGNDTLALLPTGGGKSLCYQVPALAQEGICIVISPLIALMKDQVENLKKRGIGALLIVSGMQRKDIIRTLENARGDYFKFLYVSPERLETSLFLEYLPALNVNLIAVDEAHCIAQWGHDFRPSYLRIAALRKELPDVPVLAVTASATEKVQKEICASLTSPRAPLQSWRGESFDSKYKVSNKIQYELARTNRKEHTLAEEKLWEVLRNKKSGLKFRRQHPIQQFIADFVCLEKRLIVEIDGAYHNKLEQQQLDQYRTEVLSGYGFSVLRFTNDEVLNNIGEVVKTILEKAASITSPLSIADGEEMGVGWKVFRQSFERKNLSFSVFRVDSKINKLVRIVKNVSGSGIVYCKSRKRTSEISSLLQMHGISAAIYHAGLPQEDRSKQQKAWLENKVRVIVCTNAFGMGIDKPDVRFVVHADVPDALENYYQEAGRAGRDGKKAYAVLLYNEQDVNELLQLHTIRYPSLDQIKQVYTALVNYLQVHVNSGEDVSYSFRFDEFIRNFKLNVHQALYSLKALEQDGWIEYNEKSFIPSTIVFTTSKELLYDFYKSHPAHELLCTTLLRTYEGIFDFPAFISESLLSSVIKKSPDDVQDELHTISSFGIIKFTPQNELPQLVFRKYRVKTEDLQINLAMHEKRKELFMQRVQTMIAYTNEIKCRSIYIARYFGDVNANVCEVCDNCLNKKIKDLSDEEFSEISQSIITYLSKDKCTPDELIAKVLYPKEKTWKVLQFLQKEDKITVDLRGCLQLNP